MKRIVSSFIVALSAVSMSAQETYLNAAIATEDLNGTARYVGMGGAMEALGADLSTIGTNPAGIGLFRSSQARVSFGLNSQEDVTEFANAKKTRLSFDQVGFVLATRTGEASYLNFAFNYHKSRNFGQILNAANKLSGASLNKQTYNKAYNQIFNPYVNDYGYIDSGDNSFTQLDYLIMNTIGATPDDDGLPVYGYNEATNFLYNSYNKGYIGEYDFNLSGNINDRVYLGLTVGVHSVHYNGYSEYAEGLVDKNNSSVGTFAIGDERKITGTGYSVKAGVIVRPMEYSPFRIGLSISSPTWYDLKSENFTVVDNNTTDPNSAKGNIIGSNSNGSLGNTYEYKLYTPWKFGLSMGTTVGNWIALGASYEYADYSATDPRINDGESYDWWTDSYVSNSSSDTPMKRHTEHTLKGVSTLKVGMEMKPDANLAIRVGYNYVSPMYKDDAQKAYDNMSIAQYYTSSGAFTNWKDTHRITCGIGYTVDKFTIDAAYQYSTQEGDFYPFNSVMSNVNTPGLDNICNPTSVKDNRHQLIMTLGYAF